MLQLLFGKSQSRPSLSDRIGWIDETQFNAVPAVVLVPEAAKKITHPLAETLGTGITSIPDLGVRDLSMFLNVIHNSRSKSNC